MPLSREELFALLDRRLVDPSLAARQDAEIWAAAGASRAVLVMDLSGFTRISQARGILHFLGVYRRAIGLVVPAVVGHGGRVVKREADNVIASFGDVGAALDAARAAVAASARLDAELAEDERVYPCFGLGYGRILELSDDVYGDEVNLAFKLGEDVARRREILASAAAMTRLAAEGREVAGTTDRIELGGVPVELVRITPAA